MSTHLHPGPLPQAPDSDEHHPGPLPQTVHAKNARSTRPRKSDRERRWERQRRRRAFEEVLGWILVPIILIALYWAVKAGLGALGTTPTGLIQGIKAAISGRS